MDDQISSTTPSYGDQQHDDEGEFRVEDRLNSLMDKAADFSSREAQANVPEVDDILDLAGGAKDALERHRSTLPRPEEPSLLDFGAPEPEPSSTSKPEPEALKPVPTSSFGDAAPKQAEKEEKPTVTPSKCNSSCSQRDRAALLGDPSRLPVPFSPVLLPPETRASFLTPEHLFCRPTTGMYD